MNGKKFAIIAAIIVLAAGFVLFAYEKTVFEQDFEIKSGDYAITKSVFVSDKRHEERINVNLKDNGREFTLFLLIPKTLAASIENVSFKSQNNFKIFEKDPIIGIDFQPGKEIAVEFSGAGAETCALVVLLPKQFEESLITSQEEIMVKKFNEALNLKLDCKEINEFENELAEEISGIGLKKAEKETNTAFFEEEGIFDKFIGKVTGVIDSFAQKKQKKAAEEKLAISKQGSPEAEFSKSYWNARNQSMAQWKEKYKAKTENYDISIEAGVTKNKNSFSFSVPLYYPKAVDAGKYIGKPVVFSADPGDIFISGESGGKVSAAIARRNNDVGANPIEPFNLSINVDFSTYNFDSQELPKTINKEITVQWPAFSGFAPTKILLQINANDPGLIIVKKGAKTEATAKEIAFKKGWGLETVIDDGADLSKAVEDSIVKADESLAVFKEIDGKIIDALKQNDLQLLQKFKYELDKKFAKQTLAMDPNQAVELKLWKPANAPEYSVKLTLQNLESDRASVSMVASSAVSNDTIEQSLFLYPNTLKGRSEFVISYDGVVNGKAQITVWAAEPQSFLVPSLKTEVLFPFKDLLAGTDAYSNEELREIYYLIKYGQAGDETREQTKAKLKGIINQSALDLKIKENAVKSVDEIIWSSGTLYGIVKTEDIAEASLNKFFAETYARLDTQIKEKIKKYYYKNRPKYLLIIGGFNEIPLFGPGKVKSLELSGIEPNIAVDILKASATKELPVYLSEAITSLDIYPLDYYYADVDGDLSIELITGRIPFDNQADVEKYYQKLKASPKSSNSIVLYSSVDEEETAETHLGINSMLSALDVADKDEISVLVNPDVKTLGKEAVANDIITIYSIGAPTGQTFGASLEGAGWKLFKAVVSDKLVSLRDAWKFYRLTTDLAERYSKGLPIGDAIPEDLKPKIPAICSIILNTAYSFLPEPEENSPIITIIGCGPPQSIASSVLKKGYSNYIGPMSERDLILPHSMLSGKNETIGKAFMREKYVFDAYALYGDPTTRINAVLKAKTKYSPAIEETADKIKIKFYDLNKNGNYEIESEIWNESSLALSIIENKDIKFINYDFKYLDRNKYADVHVEINGKTIESLGTKGLSNEKDADGGLFSNPIKAYLDMKEIINEAYASETVPEKIETTFVIEFH